MPLDNAPPNAEDTSFTSAFTDAAKGTSLPANDSSSSSSSPPPSTPSTPAAPSAPSQPASTSSAAQPTQPAQQPAVQPPSSAQAAPQQPVATPMLTTARELGFQGQSETEAATWLKQQWQANQQYVQYAQQVLPHQQKFNEFLAAQQQPAPAVPPAEEWTLDKYFAERWPAPKWDDRYDKMIASGIVVKDPQTGMFMPAAGYELMAGPMIGELNQAAQSQADQIQSLFRGNPLQNIYESLEEPLMRKMEAMFQEKLNGTFSQRDTVQQIQSYETANASWIYQTDPATGQQAPTPQGLQFFNTLQSLRPKWNGDELSLIKVAEQIVGVNRQQPGAPQPVPPVNSPAPPAVQQPSVPQAPQQAPPDPRATFMQNALAKAGHSNNAGGAPATDPAQFNVASEGELGSLFSSAFRASAGKL